MVNSITIKKITYFFISFNMYVKMRGYGRFLFYRNFLKNQTNSTDEMSDIAAP